MTGHDQLPAWLPRGGSSALRYAAWIDDDGAFRSALADGLPPRGHVVEALLERLHAAWVVEPAAPGTRARSLTDPCAAVVLTDEGWSGGPLARPPHALRPLGELLAHAEQDLRAHRRGVVGIEELFLRVADLDRAVAFYERWFGIPVDKRDDERAYLQCARGHLVLQVEHSTGRHAGGGPMHFALTVTEGAFDEIVARLDGSGLRVRGPLEAVAPQRGRALFVFDPDGNEAEVNTRYLHPQAELRPR